MVGLTSNPEILPQVLYIDDLIIAVNKPAGLLSIPDGYHPDLPCLSRILKKEFGNVWVVHRLDKDTSGVILFARNAHAHKELNQQFSAHTVIKEYHAIIEGNPPWEETTIDAPLKVNGDRRHRTTIDHEKGKPARTRLKVLEKFDRASLVLATPLSGYTHQIRAHLSSVGFPIIADPLYNPRYKKAELPTGQTNQIGILINRLALHAWQLSFQNPISRELLVIQAAYPKDFLEILEKLRLGQ